MNRIKELRENKGLTQKEVAKAIFTNQRNISRWENEQNEPTSSFLEKLADFFNCSIDYLVGRENDFGNIIVSNGPTVPALTEKENLLLKMFRQVDERTQFKVLGYLEAYI